ncbi:hypothetical protein SERLA73DRAFT_81414 [Serpula lacrymans var. lacrymans S7.3]|uniref:Uncharacterized protein n=1 Tax=Serpula lacrymans var. lacrymans (strain S7.3) TaxID=936435 RepID=F8QKZ7_SERL3|nr:hypothetical protein SERLA73DRAFT_81414 [Serpula lacrymans var. lacrymans S7.3]
MGFGRDGEDRERFVESCEEISLVSAVSDDGKERKELDESGDGREGVQFEKTERQ